MPTPRPCGYLITAFLLISPEARGVKDIAHLFILLDTDPGFLLRTPTTQEEEAAALHQRQDVGAVRREDQLLAPLPVIPPSSSFSQVVWMGGVAAAASV